MDILSGIHRYCVEHGITYSIACGTLLGAIRHQGYIPWDDDIDIYIYRTDYNKLISLFPEKYENSICIASLERDPLWDRPYAIAYDNRTHFMESQKESRYGVSIDIFPIDDVPDSNRKWEWYNTRRRFLQNVKGLKNLEITRSRSIIKNIIVALAKVVLYPFPSRALSFKLDRFAQKHNGKDYYRAFECCRGMLQKRPFNKLLFSSVKEYVFEDRYYMGFTDADSYLKNAYGDYMVLPPIEKQVSHHSFKAYWIIDNAENIIR